jgi:hypothetical protein
MRNVNQKRRYSNIKMFNDCCGTALHEPTDKFVGDEGAVIRCGGEIDFIVANPTTKIAKKNRNILRKVTRLNNNALHQSAGLGQSR